MAVMWDNTVHLLGVSKPFLWAESIVFAPPFSSYRTTIFREKVTCPSGKSFLHNIFPVFLMKFINFLGAKWVI